jgi:O-antigen/teichoic acid export membrane protein
VTVGRSMIVYTLGAIAERGGQILLLPIYTRIFSPDEFGVLDLVTVAGFFVMVLLTSGMDGAVGRYYVDEENAENKGLYASTAFIYLIGLSALGLLIIVPLSGMWSNLMFGDSRYGFVLTVAGFAYVASVHASYLRNILRLQFRPKMFSVLSFGMFVSQALLAVLFVVVLDQGIKGAFLSIAIAATGFAFLTFFLIRRDIYFFNFSGSAFHELISFGLPLLPYAVAMFMMQSVDRFVISKYAGLEAVGMYAVAYKLAGIIHLMMAGLRRAWGPHVYATYRQVGASAEFSKVFSWTTWVLVNIAVLLGLFSWEVIKIVAGDEYIVAAPVLPMIATGLGLQVLGTVFSTGLGIAKSTAKMAGVAGVALAVNLILNLVLVPRYGIIGAGTATVVGSTIFAVVLLVMSQRRYPIRYEYRSLTSLCIVGAAIVFTAFEFFPGSSVYDLGVRVALGAGYALTALIIAKKLRGIHREPSPSL